MKTEKKCKMEPYISIQYCTKDSSGSFIFNPECRCKSCKDLKREFMIIAERIRRSVPVEEAIAGEKCYFHGKEIDFCEECVKEAVKRELKKVRKPN